MSDGAVPQRRNGENGNHHFNKFIMAIFIVLVGVIAVAVIYYTARPTNELFDCYYYIEGEVSSCSYENEPVCAKISTNQSDYQWKTFDNACLACLSGEDIIGYIWNDCASNNRV